MRSATDDHDEAALAAVGRGKRRMWLLWVLITALVPLTVFPAGVAEARTYVDLEVRERNGNSYVVHFSIRNATRDGTVEIAPFSASIVWWGEDGGTSYCKQQVREVSVHCNVPAGAVVDGTLGVDSGGYSEPTLSAVINGKAVYELKLRRLDRRSNRPLTDPAPPNTPPDVPQVAVTPTFAGSAWTIPARWAATRSQPSDHTTRSQRRRPAQSDGVPRTT